MGVILVLTATPDLPIYRELERAGAGAGVAVQVADASRVVSCGAPAGLWLRGEPLDLAGVTAALPRVGNWRPDSTLAAAEVLEAAGVPLLNPPAAIRAGRDHWLTILALAAAGLPHPLTVAGSEPEALAASAQAVCGFPCVVKQRRSRQGVGVIRCASAAELDAVLDSLWRLGDEVVVQRFCPPGGVSRRVLVLAGEVLGATEHTAAPGEFRANAARGAVVRAVALDPSAAGLASTAAGALGLGFAGVDLLPDGGDWVVGEVNPTPGWRHFAAATGIPVAERLLAALRATGRTA